MRHTAITSWIGCASRCAKGKLKPDDVAILYFEPKGNAVSIHSMSLDADGNLLGAPASYREFFLRETDRLLGFAD